MKTKKITMYVLALATGFLFMVSSCNKESNLNNEVNTTEGALKKASGPSANGQGIFMVNDVMRHFTFQANSKPDGSVKGSGLLNYNGAENAQIKFDIDCFDLISDNTAQMSGHITSFAGNPDYVGSPCIFLVVDNGEGNNSDADQITFLYYQQVGDPWVDFDCHVDEGLNDESYLRSITSGNIQVKP